MKHFYTLLLFLVATAVAGFAAQNKYTLDIDHADRVNVRINYGEPEKLVDGINVFTYDSTGDYGITVMVEPSSSDYALASVVNWAGTSMLSSYSTSAQFYFDESEASHYYKITTKDLTENRTASLTVTVDAPEKLSLRFSGTYRAVSFTENETVVKFDPATESPISLEKQYSDTFYGVKLNDVDIDPDQYGYYNGIAIKDGDKLDVQLKAPDIDYNYTITEEEDGFITDVKVDGVSVENVHSFKAHAGTTVELYGNTGQYIFEKMIIGGTTVTSFYSTYTFTATADSDIQIYAHKPGQYAVSFDIDDPDNVVIYQGYDSSTAFTLVAGKQDIMFTESTYAPYITIKASANGVLKSVKKNDYEQLSYSTSVYTQVSKGDEFVITTEKIVRDWNAAIYVKNIESSYGVNIVNQNTHDNIATVKEGYTTFKCGPTDTPAGLSVYLSDATATVYLDDEVLSPMYEGGTTFNVPLADQTVIKVFINESPAKYNLTYQIEENVEGLSLRRDHVKTVSDFSAATAAHAGTVYHLTLADHASHTVTLDGKDLTFNEDNVAEFTPEADAVLAVAKIVDGIENVAVGSASKEIYNLQGIRVDGEASQLPAGVYVIGGKKTLVK